jgi:hypothetical protein
MAQQLSEEQLAELLGLIKGADTVELKLTIPDSDQRSTVQSLKLDPLDAFVRQVVFFDTPELDLDKAGVVVRARRSQGRDDDSVVKLRPVVPDSLSGEVRAKKGFGVEVDAMPGGFVCSCSYKHSLDAGPVWKALHGEVPVSELFSKGQRAFYEEHAPDGIELDDLSLLGPIPVFKLKCSPEGYDRKLVTELWLYPDGTRILELSTKCEPGEAFDVAVETRVFLGSRGISDEGEQQTKTRTALEYFAGTV